jgi:23S rRNA pseudouridine2605 synthase
MGKDHIEVDGVVMRGEPPVYFVLNKPRGVVTTASDEKGREIVYEYVPEGTPWMGAVGRLDKASEGLLLLTNDSEWAARVTAPETHLEKTYQVQVSGEMNARKLEAMTKGVLADDGEVLRAKRAEVLRSGEKNMWLMVVLDEGKNRQIRRMLEKLGIEVLRLVRVAIGPLELGELGKGECRELTKGEKEMIDRAIAKLVTSA